jgi:ecotropic viral integration site 5 protein
MSVDVSSPPHVAPTHSKSDSLAALLSPQDASFQAEQARVSLSRVSIAESEFNDVALDEDALLSPIALSSNHSLDGKEDSDSHDDAATAVETPLRMSAQQDYSHKKSASTTTIRSSHNLDSATSDDASDKRRSDRTSLGGTQRLHEELARLQRADEEASEEKINAAIDWGMWITLHVSLLLTLRRDFWGAVISGLLDIAFARGPVHAHT